MARKFIRKVFINKRTKQPSISLSKKQLRSADPTIKFDKDLFVSIEILKKKK